MKRSVIYVLFLALILVPATVLAASDQLVMTRAEVTTATDEIVVLLNVTNSRNLEALDIPLEYSEGALLEKVEFTNRVKGLEFQAASIDNEKRQVLIGLVNMGPRSDVPDLAAGSGTVAKLYFKVSPDAKQLEIVPFEAKQPDHLLAWYYNDESTGEILVKSVQPEVVNTSFRPGDWAIPDVYGLSQNTPNPFNPVTSFSYSLPQAGDVKLTVFNILGQNVRNLVNNYQEAGTYSVVWDGKDASGKPVSSGVYFYQIKTGEYEKTRKMMLLK